jgi:large repetitive protein
MSTDEICANESVMFENLSDVADLKWDFGDSTIVYPNSDTITHTYVQSGEYQVSLIGRSTDYQCWDTLSRTINVKPTPKAYISTSQTVGCLPFTVYFETDSSFNHLWDFGDQSQISVHPYHTYIESGLYSVQMISEFENLCSDTAFIEIRALPKPISDFSIISLGGYPEKINLENKSVDAIDCEWILPNNETINSCENVQIEFDKIEIFSIKLVAWNQYNCPDTCTKEHEVFFKGLFIPTAFSPDNPSVEIRKFIATGIGLKEYNLQVYDTYGNKIWETSSLEDSKPAEGWDGTYNGEMLQQDVYLWKADAIFLDNTIWQGMEDETGKLKKYGTVTLIR